MATVKEIRYEIAVGSIENYDVWFRDVDGDTEYPVATAELDMERRRLVLIGETK